MTFLVRLILVSQSNGNQTRDPEWIWQGLAIWVSGY